MTTNHQYKIAIVGGGTAGIAVAARLKRARKSFAITIFDPARMHYYQPMWTLVGAGIVSKETTAKPLSSLVPKGVQLVSEAVTEFFPEQNELATDTGKRYGYDYLIVAPGIKLDWEKVKGLKESIGKDGVCSNYAYEYADKTWEFLKGFTGGQALFTHPNTPIKCGGAPMKIMFLAEDYFRIHGLREKAKVTFASANAEIFQVQKYAETLEKLIKRRDIETLFRIHLVEVRPQSKEAIFQHLDTGEELIKKYDLLHVTPPMSSPDFIKNSPLADGNGWVDVDKYSLQHKRYPNVFSIGDASNLPTSKTGAAIRAEAPVLVKNLISVIEGEALTAKYNGYTSCPIVTGYGKLVLAEFDYEKNLKETFPIDQSKERRSMYLLKRYVLPEIYWRGMMKGRL